MRKKEILNKQRAELIKLLKKYKILLKRIIKDKNIDSDKNEVISKLKNEYKDIQQKLIDKNLFVKYLGENFDYNCENLKDSDNDKYNDEKIKDINDIASQMSIVNEDDVDVST